jgi:hypothetical protein
MLGNFHFLRKLTDSGPYKMLWKPDRFFNIYIFGLLKIDQGIEILKISKFTWLLEKTVFAYIITIDFHI